MCQKETADTSDIEVSVQLSPLIMNSTVTLNLFIISEVRYKCNKHFMHVKTRCTCWGYPDPAADDMDGARR